LIDDEDQQIGVIDVDEARQMARDADLDLVEVSPKSSPPVCRIMDYGKWKYQQRKKEQKARSHSKKSELKEVRLRPKIDKHDLDIKMAKANEFLEEGNKVQFTMLFRGREMAHRDLGIKAMHGIRDDLAHLSKVETHPRMAGRRMTMVLAPDKTGAGKKAGQTKPKAAKAKPAPADPMAGIAAAAEIAAALAAKAAPPVATPPTPEAAPKAAPEATSTE
jgi:translation initiation factor IF-3